MWRWKSSLFLCILEVSCDYQRPLEVICWLSMHHALGKLVLSLFPWELIYRGTHLCPQYLGWSSFHFFHGLRPSEHSFQYTGQAQVIPHGPTTFWAFGPSGDYPTPHNSPPRSPSHHSWHGDHDLRRIWKLLAGIYEQWQQAINVVDTPELLAS